MATKEQTEQHWNRWCAALAAALLCACGGTDDPEQRDTINPPQCANSEACK